MPSKGAIVIQMLTSVLWITETAVHTLSAATHLETTTVPVLEGISATDSAAQVSKTNDHLLCCCKLNTANGFSFPKIFCETRSTNVVSQSSFGCSRHLQLIEYFETEWYLTHKNSLSRLTDDCVSQFYTTLKKLKTSVRIEITPENYTQCMLYVSCGESLFYLIHWWLWWIR